MAIAGSSREPGFWKSRRWQRRAFSIFWYAFLGTVALLVIMPFIWMISTSLKEPSEIFRYPPTWIPKAWNWKNYSDAFRAAPFGRYFLNSLIIAVAVTIGQLITCSLAGFAFARMNFRGKDFMFALFLSTTMISTQVTLVPSYLVLKEFGWLDTYKGLIVPFLASAFGVFMLRQHFMTIPRDLEDAAKLDGCGRLRFLISVMLPLSKPVLAAQALFAFMGNWNSYLWPLIVTSSTQMRTLQIGLRYFVSQEGGTQWGMYMAAAVFVSAPIVVLYFAIQKTFVEGLVTTGLKGA
jgi:multiple sugar transport system permease protein